MIFHNKCKIYWADYVKISHKKKIGYFNDIIANEKHNCLIEKYVKGDCI